MPRGGKRPGAGRKKGDSPIKAQAALARKKALALLDNGTTPLDYLVKVMTGELPYEQHRFEAAKAAAPYVHPKLAAVEHSGEIVSKHETALDALERAAGAKDNDLDDRVIN